MSQARFTRMADAGVAVVRGTYAERGDQYGDTMESCEWLTLRAVAKEVLGISLSKDTCRLLAVAGLVDVKHERQVGGFKLDHLVDGAAYTQLLIGEMEEWRQRKVVAFPPKGGDPDQPHRSRVG